jgi:hypothetical protein
MIDFKKYKRFFAFGCSFTQYKWPSWADLIAQEIPESYNYGLGGSSNVLLYLSFMEVHQKYQITSDDLVIFTWTNCAREDRYLDGRWHTPGNIYTTGFYDAEYVKKYADLRGYFLRDMGIIQGTKLILDSLKVDHHFHCMVPLQTVNQYTDKAMRNIKDIESRYADVLAFIKPSYHEVIFDFDWLKRQPRPSVWYNNDFHIDPHPTPDEHLEYILKIHPGTVFKQSTVEYANEYTKRILADAYIQDIEYIKRPDVSRL